MDRRQPNTAAAEDRDPFARRHPGLIDHAVPGGRKAAAHAGGIDEGDGLRQRDEIDVRARDLGVPTVAPGVVEHREPNIQACALVTSLALFTDAAAVVDRRDDTVAGSEAAHIGADLLDHSAVLMTEHEGYGRLDTDPGPSAVPDVVVGEAHAIRLDPQNHVGGLALRSGQSEWMTRGSPICSTTAAFIASPIEVSNIPRTRARETGDRQGPGVLTGCQRWAEELVEVLVAARHLVLRPPSTPRFNRCEPS